MTGVYERKKVDDCPRCGGVGLLTLREDTSGLPFWKCRRCGFVTVHHAVPEKEERVSFL